jgi:hypothetical protein
MRLLLFISQLLQLKVDFSSSLKQCSSGFQADELCQRAAIAAKGTQGNNRFVSSTAVPLAQHC